MCAFWRRRPSRALAPTSKTVSWCNCRVPSWSIHTMFPVCLREHGARLGSYVAEYVAGSSGNSSWGWEEERGRPVCEVGEADGGGCMNTTLMLVSSMNAVKAQEEKRNGRRGKIIIKSNKINLIAIICVVHDRKMRKGPPTHQSSTRIKKI